MLNEAKYRETVNDIENGMETCRSRIESWKAVGKNYSLKKNGQPYADIAKAFNGVDGVEGVRKYKLCGAPQYFLRNSAGFSVEITGMSIPEIEKEIEREIEEAEKILQHYKRLLDFYNESIEKCDRIAEMYFAMFDDKEMAKDFSAHNIVKGYLRSTIDGWKCKQHM